ncbi:MAG: PH domain-containing protein [Caldilineaceae bacterium]
MVFQPAADKTKWEGLVVSGWLLLIDILLLAWIAQRPTDSLRFLLIILVMLTLPLLLHLLYRPWGAFTLEYWVDRNAITVRWANVRQVIPLHAIHQMVAGDETTAAPQRWRYWPAPYVHKLWQTGSPLTLFATRPLAECLVLDVGDAHFAISPAAAEEFVAAVQDRYRLGASQPLNVEQLRTSLTERFWGRGGRVPCC